MADGHVQNCFSRFLYRAPNHCQASQRMLYVNTAETPCCLSRGQVRSLLLFQLEATLCALGREVKRTQPQASLQSPPQVKVHEVIKYLVTYFLHLV